MTLLWVPIWKPEERVAVETVGQLQPVTTASVLMARNNIK